MKKALVVASPLSGESYGALLEMVGFECEYLNNTFYDMQLDQLMNNEYDLMMLIGGADVDPFYYDQPAHPETSNDFHSRSMDNLILSYGGFIDVADSAGVPIVGICKGSQQLCVHQGGALHQHVENHQNHDLIDHRTGEVFYTTGGHHQVVDITGVDCVVLAEPPQRVGDLDIREPDVVYYPEINAMGFQYHPEWASPDSRAVSYFHEKLEELLNENVRLPVCDELEGCQEPS